MTCLTGIKPTGEVHIGNYIGAIRESLKLSEQSHSRNYFFIADHHALTSCPNPKDISGWVHHVAACWLACGLSPKKDMFYLQSHIPELFELNWILSCITPKGMMNRAHAYKMKIDENKKAGKKDLDSGINLGLYSYPVLMSADILLFSPDVVPVGKDQTQHVEMARDLAQKFNNTYKTDLLKIPEMHISDQLILGLDGRKMSKNYNNTIPLFCSEKELHKKCMQIKTDSKAPEEPKDTSTCTLFSIYKNFSTEEEVKDITVRYKEGIGWGEMKNILFEKLNDSLKDKQEKYKSYMSNPAEIKMVLKNGSEQAREFVRDFMKEIKKVIGINN